ncbi:MAG: YihY/virulence factor BrkB family protein [SAR202 cluster bacterium]|nr:YihY/virulence factor BrkB family protein [SAR202 cluster bacterium]
MVGVVKERLDNLYSSTGLRRRVKAVRRRLERNFLAVLVWRTIKEIQADDVTHFAAGIGYYVMFSIFPLLLGLTALMSFFLESEEAQRSFLDFIRENLPGSGAFLEDNLEAVQGLRGALGIFAILGLMWTGSAVFGAINRAINRAWDIHKDRPFYKAKPRQLFMALCIALLFIASIAAASFVRIAAELAEANADVPEFLLAGGLRIALQVSSFVLTLMIFLMVYKFLPNTKTYWKYVWPGAILGAVLFEIGKAVFLTYIQQFANFENVYGSLAPVIALMLWAYYSSIILLVGAELNAEFALMKKGLHKGELVVDDIEELPSVDWKETPDGAPKPEEAVKAHDR